MEIRQIQPLNAPVDAEVRVPGSKSITNRALVIAALAAGETHLTHALFSDDTHYMSEALKTLGIGVQANEGASTFTVSGTGGRIPVNRADLFIGNSGTTTRFLTAYLALGHGTYTVDGVDRMQERPIQDLLDGLNRLGGNACSKEGNGCPPICIKASGLKGGRTYMAGDQSSQFFTALLLVAPYAEQDVEVRVEGDLVSKPYIDITLAMMRDFGVEVRNDSYGTFQIRAGQRYRPQTGRIEPDASNASYFFGMAALTGGRVKVRDLTAGSIQGDVGFVDVLAQMGCRVQKTSDGIEVQGPDQLKGLDIDMNAMPDVVQTLCALAPFADRPVTVRNAANMRIKETDRICALATELRRLGIRVETRPDGLTVYPTGRIQPARLKTYDDHRMAMSLSLIGLKAPGVVIKNPSCVNKTCPPFFNLFDAVCQTATGI